MKYKIGDKVVMKGKKDLEDNAIFKKYAHQMCTIVDINGDLYKVEFEEGDYKFILEERIDHEATADLIDINKEFEKIAAGILTNNIEEMQNSNPTIKVKIGDKIIYSKGGETMNANEILDTWGNKKCKELRYKADAEKDKISAQDEIRKLILDHKAQINETLKEKFKVDTEVDYVFNVLITEKTRKKLEEIEEKVKIEEDKVNKKVKEIKAVLEVAENQDKVFEILNKQGIIDKNYNIL